MGCTDATLLCARLSAADVCDERLPPCTQMHLITPLPPAGRAWDAAELRLKSKEDLHALWFLCLKERNMLLSERLYYRQVGQMAPEGERLRKTRKTMARIKVVVGERARAEQAMERDKALLAALKAGDSGVQEGAQANSAVDRKVGGWGVGCPSRCSARPTAIPTATPSHTHAPPLLPQPAFFLSHTAIGAGRPAAPPNGQRAG